MNKPDDNFIDEFNKIVASLQDVKTSSRKIEKRHSSYLDVIVSVLLLLSGIALLIISVTLVNMLIAVIGFLIMLVGGLKTWKTFIESSSVARITTKYNQLAYELYEKDIKRYAVRPQGQKPKPEDEFWSF